MELKPTLLSIEDDVLAAVEDLVRRNAVERIWAKDQTLWMDEAAPTRDQMGWLDLVDSMPASVSELETFAAGVRADGLHKAVVLGMGGSSVFAGAVSKIYATEADGLELDILDTTDPAAVNALLADRRATETLFVAASKSGSTVETVSQLATCWAQLQRGSQFTAVTDPGSDLLAIADRDGFRRVFLSQPDVGGRFGALGFLGLLPAALVGAPISDFLDRARSIVPALKREGAENPGVLLGAAMAVASLSGRDKLTILLDRRIAPLGAWLEQLVAESTGKNGRGVVPVVDEPIRTESYGPDRFVVSIGDVPGVGAINAEGIPAIAIDLSSKEDLGAQVLLWEFATAVAGAVLGVNPFDQPNVASAKSAAAAVLAAGQPIMALEPVPELMAQLEPGDYLAICAFVDPGSATVGHLERKRQEIGRRLGIATTLGIGPRYLHATGQLHKGKPQNVVVAQILGADRTDVGIPGASYSFSQLKAAQAAGDYEALKAAGARVARVALNEFLDW